MSVVDLSLIAAVAVICAVMAQITSGYSKGGLIVNLMVAFIGAVVGVYASRELHAPTIYDLQIGEVAFPVIYCLLGSVLMSAGIGFFVKPGRN